MGFGDRWKNVGVYSEGRREKGEDEDKTRKEGDVI